MIRLLNIRLLTTVLLLVMTISISAKDKQQNSNITSKEYSSLYSLPKFERAVLLIKHCEGMHSQKDYPYIGYGHRLQPGEKLTSKITKRQADSLLRSDLKKLCYLFRDYGISSILLATLAYNCGQVSILGDKNKPESRLIQKIKRGEKDIENEYLTFCKWKGKVVPSIKKRRWMELRLLYKD